MKPKQFVTTRTVAEMTDLSLGTIQKMVDDGIFEFYVTSGGHRRITLSSVIQYLKERESELKQSWVKKRRIK